MKRINEKKGAYIKKNNRRSEIILEKIKRDQSREGINKEWYTEWRIEGSRRTKKKNRWWRKRLSETEKERKIEREKSM